MRTIAERLQYRIIPSVGIEGRSGETYSPREEVTPMGSRPLRGRMSISVSSCV
jgi:hypothetical protein